MQVVILAAGAGVRMRPLTADTPKPLLRIGGQTLLDHIFAALPAEVDHAVIVVKYLADQIKKYCGANFHGRAITYAEGSALGTAYSFLAARPHLVDERFLFLYGDELPSRQDVAACLTERASILCWRVADPEHHGVVAVGKDGIISEIIEKPAHPAGNLIADGVMVLNKKIFSYAPEKQQGEYFFTDMLNHFVREERVTAVASGRGIGGISTPADIARVEAWLAAHPRQ